VSGYLSEVRGYVESGEYTFRQLVSQRDEAIDAYILDFDYWKENVELKDALDLIKTFDKTNFSFFFLVLRSEIPEVFRKGQEEDR
jgi:hypothetical protein